MRNWSALPRQPLEDEYPYLILDARYEKVREDGVVRSRAVLVAIGIDYEGRRRILGVELANRESTTSWREFLLRPESSAACSGVRLAISDDHAGLRRALAEVLTEGRLAALLRPLPAQRARLPAAQRRRRVPDRAALALRPARRRRSPRTSRAWLRNGRPNTPNSAPGWRKTSRKPGPSTASRASTTNTSKAPTCSNGSTRRLKRRTHIVRIFPNEASCLRLVRALASEQHEEWLDGARLPRHAPPQGPTQTLAPNRRLAEVPPPVTETF